MNVIKLYSLEFLKSDHSVENATLAKWKLAGIDRVSRACAKSTRAHALVEKAPDDGIPVSAPLVPTTRIVSARLGSAVSSARRQRTVQPVLVWVRRGASMWPVRSCCALRLEMSAVLRFWLVPNAFLNTWTACMCLLHAGDAETAVIVSPCARGKEGISDEGTTHVDIERWKAI
jgi:hypothetical protein